MKLYSPMFESGYVRVKGSVAKQRKTYGVLLLIILLALNTQVQLTTAQSNTLQAGDPPVTSRIQISEPDENGIVTITGEANAVFPTALVVVRNLYTNQQVITNAGIAGGFTARIYGPGNTPFWISPATRLDDALRTTDQTVPGGPGTIIYGQTDNVFVVDEDTTETLFSSSIVIDGVVGADWANYANLSMGMNWRGFTNTNSIYLALEPMSTTEVVYAVDLSAGNSSYTLRIYAQDRVTFQQTGPVSGNEQPIITPVRISDDATTIELRLTRELVAQGAGPVQLDRIYALDGDEIVDETLIETPLQEILAETDGLIPPAEDPFTAEATPFTLAGSLTDNVWTAEGRISSMMAVPGDRITLDLEITLNASRLPDALIGEIIWQPITIAGLYTNNGWSNLQTPSGLAVDNVYGDVAITTTTVPNTQIVQQSGQLQALMRVEMTVPADLPPGRYVPAFTGFARFGDDIITWDSAFADDVPEPINTVPTRLPVVINIGDLAETRLLWTLFYDDPADGVRGIIPQEDQERAALSNRVKFNAPTYILPPGNYPIEPYLPSMLPNQYDLTSAPLLPLLLPGGRLDASITTPDGTIDNLPGTPIAQNRLSSSAIDERTRFGGQSPIDLYRLTTLNDSYTDYAFESYGDYQIELNGSTEDIFGNVYTGGGTYQLRIAEPLEFLPGVLPGAPFEVDDAPFLGGRVLPGLPADVTISVTTYDLNGQPTQAETFTTQASRYGTFAIAEGFTFSTAGEYVIDYDITYTTPEGQLWAASLRSAGVISNPDSTLLARGQRGVDQTRTQSTTDYLPYWFTAQNYPADSPSRPRLYYPYHNGDVARIADSFSGGMTPLINAYDLTNSYQNWLLGSIPDYTSPRGLSIATSSQLEAIPLQPLRGGPRTPYGVALEPDFIANQAYTYISAVRPGVSLRQFVAGGEQTTLPLYWDSADPYNQQIGAGSEGDEPGDYVFLFGGLVVRNPEANIATTDGYAAFATVIDAETTPQVYPPYRGTDGGPDGGPLVSVRGEDYDMIFYPTGTRPGDTLTVDDEITIAGHVAPTLESRVAIEITAPDGNIQTFAGLTNQYGYFYDPTLAITADTEGIWSIEIITQGIGASSAGLPTEPSIEGGVPGTVNRTFNVYVLPANADPLRWNGDVGDTDVEVRGGDPFNFNMRVPSDWTDIAADFSVTTPAYLLDAGTPRIGGSTVTYQYNPPQLSTIFPNLETSGTGISGGDVVTLTFAITGTNDSGRREMRTRTFTILFDRLVSFEDLARE